MTSTRTGKEGAVLAAVEAWRKAIIAADKPALEALTAAELSYGHSSGRMENKTQFIEALTSGGSGFSEIELDAQTVDVVDKIAIVRHVFNATRRKQGDKVKLCNLTIWMLQKGQWKLLARQAAKL